MPATDLHQLTPDALRARADELSSQVHALSFAAYRQKEKNVKRLKMLRHELAGVLTVLTEREKTPSSSPKR
jgi:ribosomal protein L29